MMLINSKVRMNKRYLMWYIVLIPLMRTNGYVEHHSILSRVNNFLAFISIFFIAYAFVKRRKFYSFKGIMCIVFMLVYVLMRTLQQNNVVNISSVVVPIIYCIGLSLYVLYLIDQPLLLIKALFINLELIVYINFITLILFKNGLYLMESGSSGWFLGYDNWWFVIFYVSYFIAIVHYKMTGKRIRSILMIVILHASAFLTMSGVLLSGILIMDVFVFSRTYKARIVNYRNMCISVGLINAVLITLYSSGIVAFFLALIRRPVSTLLVRNRIWKVTIEAIKNNLVWGYGRKSYLFRTSMYNLPAGVNAHNMWLEMMYEGGMVVVIIFTILVSIAWRAIYKSEDNDIKQLLIVCLLTCGIGLSVDSVFLENRGNLFFALFILASNFDVFCKQLCLANSTSRQQKKIWKISFSNRRHKSMKR